MERTYEGAAIMCYCIAWALSQAGRGLEP